MSDYIIDKLSTINLGTLIVLILFIVFVLKSFLPGALKIKEYIIKQYQEYVKKKTLESIVYETQEKLQKNEESYLKDKEQSDKIHKELTEAIISIENKLEVIKEQSDRRYKENLERTNKRLRAELKDKIGRSYKLYHKTKAWNDIEKEALEDLIEEYEEAGGTNSFVHTVVIPEMYTWELISRD